MIAHDTASNITFGVFNTNHVYTKVLLQNSTLHQELEQLKQENMELRARLSKYQDV